MGKCFDPTDELEDYKIGGSLPIILQAYKWLVKNMVLLIISSLN